MDGREVIGMIGIWQKTDIKNTKQNGKDVGKVAQNIKSKRYEDGQEIERK